MKTKLLLACTAFALLLTACEEEKDTSFVNYIPYEGPYIVKVYAGLPGKYGNAEESSNKVYHPVSDVTIKIYRTQEDYLLDQNILLEGLTSQEGLFSFEYDSAGSLWFSAQKDTLSNLRGITNINPNTGIAHNELINEKGEGYTNHGRGHATLTNIPTRLQLSVSHQGQPIEGATVQLYFTEQTYLDSLPAQKDFEHLRPTYGYFVDEEGTSGEERYFVSKVEDSFLQTTDEEGVVVFDNLEPRNYWFRITKDTLSNEGTTIRTLRALPQNKDITTSMTVGLK